MSRDYNTTIEPWLKYFGMLRKHEEEGYLDVQTDKHEAYVTRPALLVIAGVNIPTDKIKAEDKVAISKALKRTALMLRAYSTWKSLTGSKYLSEPFAVIVVGDEYPHDPLFVLHVSRRFWRDKVKFINYQ